MGNLPSAPHEPLQGRMGPAAFQRGTSLRRSHGRGMDRLRRSFRDSFRRRKGDGGGGGGGGSLGPESARAHQWHDDEIAVRNSTCAFHVKYMGCVEVFESRGMQVCEEALKVLRSSRRRAVRAMLHVSGDGLRVVEEDTKGLIVDQTIEKVSFCAPDRNHERGFSYICRDGTTRRWMCHGFLAVRDPGERLSHAVGCAFSACLERKQRRDKDVLVAAEITKSHQNKSLANGGTRSSSIDSNMTQSLSEKTSIISHNTTITSGMVVTNTTIVGQSQRTPLAPNPFAIERPHAAAHMLERQGSFRGFSHLNNNSPFKRQMSLRISDLPSNLERLRTIPTLPPLPQTTSYQTPAAYVPTQPPQDPDLQVAAFCQQVSRELQLLTQGEGSDIVPVEEVPLEQQALPAPDQWLGRLTSPPAPPHSSGVVSNQAVTTQVSRRAPLLSQRARSLGGDPFDADWAAPPRTTNPFLQRAI